MSARILVADDEVGIVQALRTLLTREGYQVATASSGPAALTLLAEHPFDLLITDIVMEPMNGMELLQEARKLQPGLPIIMITGYASIETAVEAKEDGAFDYVRKPFRIADLLAVVRRALAYERSQTSRHAADTVEVKYHFGALVGECPAMTRVFELVAQLAVDNATVLLLGEVGTGRGVIARALHHNSKRATGPVVEINCNVGTEAEVESALFGGSMSCLVRAHEGTLILRGVGALSLDTQHKFEALLTQGDQVRSAGGVRKPASVRLVLTAQSSLEQMAAAGTFLESLFRSLRAVTIELPPLRQRPGDLELLLQHFLNLRCQPGTIPLRFAADALAAMEKYTWPGNIQELERTVSEAVLRTESDVIGFNDLAEVVQEAALAPTAPGAGSDDLELRWRSLSQFLSEREVEHVRAVLADTDGDVEKAAALLGMSAELFRKRYGHLLPKT